MPKHLEIALNYADVLKEIGANQGWNDKEFEALAIKAGWRKGYSWCAFFVKVCLTLAGAKIHKKWAGLARDYWTYANGKTITITEALNGNYMDLLKPGMLVIYGKGKGITGHIAIIKEVLPNYRMILVEGNTSVSEKGSQSNGDVATIKNRPLNRGTEAWHIIGFAEAVYE